MTALTVLIVLSLPGCASKKQITQSETTAVAIVESRDTTYREVRQTTTVAVPESQAQMKIATTDLLSLPPGAAYQKKEGRATIRAETRGDTVYIAGVCDSLAREVERYESLYHTAMDALHAAQEQHAEEVKEIRKGYTLWDMATATATGTGLGIVITIIIETIIIRKRHGNK